MAPLNTWWVGGIDSQVRADREGIRVPGGMWDENVAYLHGLRTVGISDSVA